MSYRITKRSTLKGLAFDLYFRWKGQRYRPLLGYNLTKAQVDQAAIAMIAKIQAEPEEQGNPYRTATLRDILPLFWNTFDLKRRIDRVRPKGIIENHLLPAFGDHPLVSLTAKDGLDYVLQRQKAKASAGTIRREWQVLTRLLNLAV